jgi:hypothetical protein
MPDIDLEPHEYGHHDPKTGKINRRLSKRFFRNCAFVGMAVLGFIFWHRTEVDAGLLFGVTAAFSLETGVFLANWLYDVF